MFTGLIETVGRSSGVEGERLVRLRRQPPGLVRGRQPGERGQGRLVVFKRVRQLVVEVFRAERLDAVLAEGDLLGDQQAAARLRVEVGEIGPGDMHGKGGQPRERGEADLAGELLASPVAEGVREVARELDEEIGVQAVLGARVCD